MAAGGSAIPYVRAARMEPGRTVDAQVTDEDTMPLIGAHDGDVIDVYGSMSWLDG